MIAFRLDGEPVDWADFEKIFGGRPEDLGSDVVAIAGTGTTTATSKYFFALAADGTLRSLQPGARELLPAGPTDTVVLADVGPMRLAVLRADGTPTIFSKGDLSQTAFAEALSWTGLVSFSEYAGAAIGLRRDGILLTAGKNDRGQLDVPAEAQGNVIAAELHGSGGYLATADNWAARFGQYNQKVQPPEPSRFFFGSNMIIAVDKRGNTRGINDAKTYHTHPTQARRDLRSAEHIVVAGGTPDGISAARLKGKQWHFWGELTPKSDFDAKHCKDMAQGCVDLLISRPYVLALKVSD